MHKLLEQVLAPLFHLAAKPGLGLPHSNHEIELLRAGAKPTGILGASDLTKLEDKIQSGDIIVISETPVPPLQYVFYFKPENEHIVKRVQSLSQKMHTIRHYNPTEEEIGLINTPAKRNFRSREEEIAYISATTHAMYLHCRIDMHEQDYFDRGKISQHEIDNIDFDRIKTETIKLLETNEIPYLLCQHSQEYLEAMVEQGMLQKIQGQTERPNQGLTIIVAQKDKEKEGHRLSQLCSGETENFPDDIKTILNDPDIPSADKNIAFHGEIGRLLGYTENDIYNHYFNIRQKGNFENFILTVTEDFRRWCRHKSMIINHEARKNAPQTPETS